MNPWRLGQQGFCTLGLSFLLGIAAAVYHFVQVSHVQRQLSEGGVQAAMRAASAAQSSLVGSMLNWSAIIAFVFAISLLLLGLISYCGQRAKAEPPR
ncbi:MAG TPA: hypothetical protein VMP01_24410 [Pirellulaceae bacterium]|nr:hypothetical protein [Pirellulaceae bacterium]